jgi:hypothetical protein
MRTRLRMQLVILALLPVFTTSAHAGTTAAGHLRYATDTNAATADYSSTPTRDQFVILQEWQGAKARTLKSQNPSLKVLMYKNLSFMGAADAYGHTGAGVTTQEADSSWYLLNTSGQRFTSWSYSYLWAADIGNPDYQKRWAANVLGKLQAQGFDGVFIDDTNPTMRYHYDVASVAKYPSDAAYSAATGSALASIGPAIHSGGKLVLCNFGTWRLYRSVVNGWLNNVDGGMEEQFTKWGGPTAGSGYAPAADWNLMLGAEKDAQSKGKYFMGVSHSAATDAQATRYGWATTLLAAGGRASFSMHADYTNEPLWIPEYDYAIGDPSGTETADSNGVHRRAFSNGLVLVNPTASSQAVSFGGTYDGSGLSAATSATMAPNSGLVLTRTASTTTDPTPPPPSTEPEPEPQPTDTSTDTTSTDTTSTGTTSTDTTSTGTSTDTTTTTYTTTTTKPKGNSKPKGSKGSRTTSLGAVSVKTVGRRLGLVWASLRCSKAHKRCPVRLRVRYATAHGKHGQRARTAVVRRGQHRTLAMRLSLAAVRSSAVTVQLRAGGATKSWRI